jgi:hypothetical protein
VWCHLLTNVNAHCYFKFLSEHTMKLFKPTIAAAACLGFLSACGGGGGDTNVVDPIDLSAVAQGYWSGDVIGGPDGARAATAIVTPALAAYVVFDNGTTVTGLAKVPLLVAADGTINVRATGSGSYYKLGTGSSKQPFAIDGIVTTESKFTGKAGGVDFIWTGNAGYKTPAKASDLDYRWRGTAGNTTITYDWTVNINGVVSGSSTAGCSYEGTVKPNASGVAVFDVSVREICSTDTRKTLSGVATLNSTKTSLQVAYTTADDAEGGLLQLTKTP